MNRSDTPKRVGDDSPARRRGGKKCNIHVIFMFIHDFFGFSYADVLSLKEQRTEMEMKIIKESTFDGAHYGDLFFPKEKRRSDEGPKKNKKDQMTNASASVSQPASQSLPAQR